MKNQKKDIESKKAEKHFEAFCKKSGIQFLKLDNKKNSEIRNNLLINSQGKSPDYFCTKGNQSIFVEIKTLIHLTNKARSEKLQKNGLDIFSPKEELRTPLKTKLEKTIKKFDNIKSQTIPRILLLNGFFDNPKWFVNAIFLGAFPAYKKENKKLVNVGFRKSSIGLFDSIGSSISSVIYWDNKTSTYGGVENNSNPLIPFSEEDFYYFFKP